VPVTFYIDISRDSSKEFTVVVDTQQTLNSARADEDALSVIWRHRRLILWTIGAVVLVALVATMVMPKRYKASVLMRVSTPGALSADSVRSDATSYLDRLENTYAKLGTSATFRDGLAKQLHVVGRPEIEIRALPNSELMTLSATTDSASGASKAANTAAALLLNQVQLINQDALDRADAAFNTQTKSIEQTIVSARAARVAATGTERARLDTEIAAGTATLAQMRASFEQSRLGLIDRATALTVVNNATKPSSAVSPNIKLNLGVALVIAILAAIALALILEYLRRRRAQIDATTASPAIARAPVAVDSAARLKPSEWRRAPATEEVRATDEINGASEKAEPIRLAQDPRQSEGRP